MNRLKKGDQVYIISGKDKGKLVYLPSINKVNDASGKESITRDEES